MQKIESFKEEPYRFLSNFWPAPVVLDTITYPSVEHAYQAAKTLDRMARTPLHTGSAAAAKKYGRRVPMRSDWNQVKIPIMRQLLTQKFAPNTPLAALLINTGDAELIEGNYWHDYFWGICNGRGENHLGKLLMEIRASLNN